MQGVAGIAAGLIFGIVLAGLGYVSHPMVVHIYEIWARLSRNLSRFLNNAIMAVGYFTIFLLLRFTGSHLDRSVPTMAGSKWVRKTAESEPKYLQPVVFGDVSKKSWMKSYLRWAWQSGNLWAVFLLPYLILLKIFRSEGESHLASNIYTLF
jgi:hypothetical protein